MKTVRAAFALGVTALGAALLFALGVFVSSGCIVFLPVGAAVFGAVAAPLGIALARSKRGERAARRALLVNVAALAILAYAIVTLFLLAGIHKPLGHPPPASPVPGSSADIAR